MRLGIPIWKSIPKPPPRMKCVRVTVTKPDGAVDSRRWYGYLVGCIHRAAKAKHPGCDVQFEPWIWED